MGRCIRPARAAALGLLLSMGCSMALNADTPRAMLERYAEQAKAGDAAFEDPVGKLRGPVRDRTRGDIDQQMTDQTTW